MKFPNKVIPYKKSILSKLPLVLDALDQKEQTPHQLYESLKSKTDDITEFVALLDCLFALNKIELTDGKVLTHVKNNQL